ncbi:Qnr family pentapeptide repeat protein [Vibrio sp. Of7-15]|uniref:Qnr family pentapeptide repeat protein n=1 Tax=Vibrio sp. Of7-15 TaxID=2724879 RepID=UPI001EF279DD|nr:Qnr family pentapeptide repeat protein [Vibrio sp. Of7-15]MCG7498272.1 Qnr family pentapeptide repeat protein [Vibrio sp. Of7-15]
MNITNKTFYDEDFSEQDLQAATFSQCHFYRCDFSRANLTEAEFSNCVFLESGDVTGCLFNYTKLKEASFKDCNLGMTSFKGTQCFGAEFRNCNLSGADFSQASFTNYITPHTYFCSAYITGCNLSYSNLEDIRLEKCELFENRWTGANLIGASFTGSDLSRGEFSEESWGQFNIEGCNLSHSDLYGLDIRRINLKGVIICEWQQEQLLSQLGLIIESN